MDTQAHLMSLGWAGPGHALDSRPQYKQKGHRGLAYNPSLDPLKVGNTGNGLVKPLSISKRKDRFGVGKKAHEPPSGTEWWLKGFENALRNIGKPESERSATSTPIPIGKHGGLYGFFVKGQVMEGTIDGILSQIPTKKRKSDAMEDSAIPSDTKKQRTGLEVSPVRRKPETALEFDTVSAFIQERDRQEKRRTRAEPSPAIDQFTQIGQFFAAGEDSKLLKKKKPKHKDETKVTGLEDDTRIETKEERRERRRKRKAEKEQAISKMDLDENDRSDGEAAKALRKAEKKRRKAEREAQKLSTLSVSAEL